MKKHQITLDFSKPQQQRGGSGGGVYMSPSPSTVNISRTASNQIGIRGNSSGKGPYYPGMSVGPPCTPSISKVKQGPRHSASATGGGDKTVCQYCGVSYLTIAEMRSLKTTVKEQNEQLLHYKELQSENSHLKEAIGSLRQTHHDELSKYEDEVKYVEERCRGLENQVECFQNGKYQDGTGDRGRVDTREDQGSALVHEKMKVLESAMRKIILNPHFKDKPETDILINRLEEVNRMILHNHASDSSLGSNKSGRNKGKGSTEPVSTKRRGKSRSRTAAAPSRMASSLNVVEVHDLRRENFNLVEKIRNLSSDFANSQEMHSNLRDTLDKLKIDNDHLHDEMSCLRVQYEESLVTNENVEAQLKGVRTENERLRSLGKEMELRLRGADEQNRSLQNSVDQNLVQRLQMTLTGLKKQIQEHQVQTEKVRAEFLQKLAEAQRETAMEKERADSCLAASLLDRQEVERRWEERWSRHQASLTEQLETLRSNYEKTLASVKAHEEALQKELNSHREKYAKTKDAWEAYRKSLNDQLASWKAKYEQKQTDLESTSQSKVDVELLYQEKSAEMESLHEIIREGCEERQELQRQIAAMKENFDEVRLQGQSCFPGNRRPGPGTPLRASILCDAAKEGSYCSFAELKEKNKLKNASMESLCPSGLMAPPPTSCSDFYIPPTTAPVLSPRVINLSGGTNTIRKPAPPIDPHLFTIGKGLKQNSPSTPVHSTKAVGSPKTAGGGGPQRPSQAKKGQKK